MSLEAVKNYLNQFQLGDRVITFHESSATVPLAAAAVGCAPAQIAKTLSFLVEDAPVLIVAAGDVKIDNAKFKAKFHQKAKMIPADLVGGYTGHDTGGVCPFAVKPGTTIYLDVSLKANEIVYPAAGNACSAVRLSIEELERSTGYLEWVDVCKAP